MILASTNLAEWVPVFTNLAGGLLDFADPDAGSYASRFYQVVESVPDPQPTLSVAGGTNGSGLSLHIETAAAVPYAIQVSTNLSEWTPIYTNQAGGTMDYQDLTASQATPSVIPHMEHPPGAPDARHT